MEDVIVLTVIDNEPASHFNKYSVTSKLFVDYSGMMELLVRNHAGYLVNASNRNDFDNAFTIYPPVRYNDARISFDLNVGPDVGVRSSLTVEKIGKQLIVSRITKIWIKCGGSWNIDAGHIRGYAELVGTLTNFEVVQETQFFLCNKEILARDLTVATVLPYSYRSIQRFQVYDCWRNYGLFINVGPWRSRIWCNWVTVQDHYTPVLTSITGRVVTLFNTAVNP